MELLVGNINSIKDNTMIWGDSQSYIELSIETESASIPIGASAQESTLTQLEFNKGTYPKKGEPPTGGGELKAFNGELVIPIIEIEYVDLCCNFAAISVVSHDVYHAFRQTPKQMKRDLFYCAYPPILPPETDTDPPNQPAELSRYKSLYDRYLGNLFGSDESMDDVEYNNTPAYFLHKAVKKSYLDSAGDCIINLNLRGTNFYSWYRLCNQDEGFRPYQRTSCAYSAETNQMVYHVKGGWNGATPLDGYVGSFSGIKFVEFEASNKTEFIDNHQIAFYYVDLG